MHRDRTGGKKTVYEVAHPEEEDLEEVTPHKCLTTMRKKSPTFHTLKFNCEERREQSSS